jgi:hypothetical protein
MPAKNATELKRMFRTEVKLWIIAPEGTLKKTSCRHIHSKQAQSAINIQTFFIEKNCAFKQHVRAR